jgi:hypothetical protein
MTLRSLIEYDPDTGRFTWKSRDDPPWDAKWAGKQAGSVGADGYWRISLMNQLFQSHRVAFAIAHGRWPTKGIDHIDGCPGNNRLSNLREATNAENQQNRRMGRKSGYPGVCWVESMKKWKAQITQNRKLYHLGYFDCPRHAHAAYLAAKARLHTFHSTPKS